ncbi:MAG: hexokinase [Sphaerochaetaceae bacterium]|nr:hexokinase [Sphaerochaetaceae bacterium]
MKVKQFLQELNFDVQNLKFSDICNDFLEQMSKGLYDGSSSLPMIPTFCKDSFEIKEGESIIVLDAGGTNLRSCMVTFQKNLEPEITGFKKTKMPGIEKEVSKKEFFSIFADQVERFIGTGCNRIGICFSYAAKITEDLDGIPLYFSKEIKAKEVVGQPVAKSLLQELTDRGHDVKKMKYAVVNDTVATLLAGKSIDSNNYYSSFIGYILGTGTNTAYSERNELIKKIDALKAGRQIINVESGNYDLVLTETDREFLDTTKDPTSYHFEKMISGAYLGKAALHLMKKAAKAEVFSKETSKKFLDLEDLNTTQMSNYLEQPYNEDYLLVRLVKDNEKDAASLYVLLSAYIKRSAFLTAANLAAVILKTGEGFNPCHPICINADGTTFYKTEFLKFYTDYYLHLHLTEKLGISYRFINIEDSPTIGAAIAALSK